jgi:hypothetical protein
VTFAEKVLAFYSTLDLSVTLPEGIQVMNPYKDAYTFQVCTSFYSKFYNDTHTRTFIAGINPGRLGGGLTGITFTDPVKLEQVCGIPNALQKKTELSADFIYQMIAAYGGADKFYTNYFFGAISPLGFTKDGKNLNYYDDKKLQEAVMPFIYKSMQKQISLGLNTEVCYCLGEGKNYEFFQKINNEYAFFKKIIPLPHPRFIMQYQRKKLREFITLYTSTLH